MWGSASISLHFALEEEAQCRSLKTWVQIPTQPQTYHVTLRDLSHKTGE